MKKQLLTGAFLLAALFSANAQDSCDTAIEITTGGTYTVDEIYGEYLGSCLTGAATNANWYSITPTQHSLIRVNTNLDVNVEAEADTRYSILSGECGGTLNCVDAIDDVSADNYLGDLTFQAEAGVTYFISFDNRWLSTGFDFEVTITPESCFTPQGFAYAETPTFTSVSIEWAVPATTPEGYEFEYGPIGFTQGTGTELDLTEPLALMDDLTSGTDYAFYVRTDCGDGDYSEWAGPITFFTPFEATELNYSYGFETDNLNGWNDVVVTGQAWTTLANADDFEAQEGERAIGSGASGAVSNTWLFSRGINVANGQVVNISYYVREYAAAGNGGTHNIGLAVGTDDTAAAQTTVITAQTAVDSEDWVLRTATWTAPAAGTYYFGFHYTAPAMTQANFGYGVIDNVVFTSPTAGLEGVATTKFSVYPNPSSSVVNIANADNMLINNVKVTDLNGRVVKTVAFDGVTEAQINVSDLSSGVYMMTVASDKGTSTQKIVKN